MKKNKGNKVFALVLSFFVTLTVLGVVFLNATPASIPLTEEESSSIVWVEPTEEQKVEIKSELERNPELLAYWILESRSIDVFCAATEEEWKSAEYAFKHYPAEAGSSAKTLAILFMENKELHEKAVDVFFD